jgi:hypothetical protein
MQEHIKRLAVEAGLVAAIEAVNQAPQDWLPELNAFAQAVARECMKVVDSRCSSERIAQLDAEGWSVVETNALSAGLEGASEAIRARFGLE